MAKIIQYLPRIAGLTIQVIIIFGMKSIEIKFLDQWSNQGCGISAPSGTFNTGFNQAGGGVFAMEWVRSKFIRVWNFVSPNIPADISSVRIC